MLYKMARGFIQPLQIRLLKRCLMNVYILGYEIKSFHTARVILYNTYK
jgi:hypothetical protein